MAIHISVDLINQSGPGWDSFVKDAKRAGLELGKISQAGKDTVKTLEGMKKREYTTSIQKLADGFGGASNSAGKLLSVTKTLAAANLIPRGHELQAVRLAQGFQMVAQAGPGAIAATGGLAVVVAGLYASYKGIQAVATDLYESGDVRVRKLSMAWGGVAENVSFARREISQMIGELPVVREGLEFTDKQTKHFMDMIPMVPGAMKAMWGRITGDQKLMMQGGLQAALAPDKARKDRQQRLLDPITPSDEPILTMRESQIKATLTARTREIEMVHKLTAVMERQRDLAKEIAALSHQGALSDGQRLFLQGQMLALKEQERAIVFETTKQQLAAFEKQMNGQIQLRQGLLRSTPHGQALLQNVSGLNENDVKKQMALQRAEQISKSRGSIATKNITEQTEQVNKWETQAKSFAKRGIELKNVPPDQRDEGWDEEMASVLRQEKGIKSRLQSARGKLVLAKKSQKDAADPKKVRVMAKGQLNLLERGGGKFTNAEASNAKVTLLREKLAQIQNDGGIDPMTMQALSEEINDEIQKELDKARFDDSVNSINKTNVRGQNKLTKGGVKFGQMMNKGGPMGGPRSAMNLKPQMRNEFVNAQEKLNENQSGLNGAVKGFSDTQTKFAAQAAQEILQLKQALERNEDITNMLLNQLSQRPRGRNGAGSGN